MAEKGWVSVEVHDGETPQQGAHRASYRGAAKATRRAACQADL